MLKRSLLGLLILCLLIPNLAFAQETPTEPTKLFVIKDIEVLRNGQLSQDAILPGDVVTIEFILESSQLTKAIAMLDQLEVTTYKGSFVSKDKASIKLISQPEEPLKLTVTFDKAAYSGANQQLGILLKGKTSPIISETHQVTMNQAVISADSKPGENPNPNIFPEPQLTYRLVKEPGTLEAGEDYMVTVELTNVGQTAVTRPVLRVKGSDYLTVSSSSSSKLISDITPGALQTTNLQFRVAEQPKAEKQSLSLDLTFNYDSGQGMSLGQSSASLELSVVPQVDEPSEVPTPTPDPEPMPDPIPSGPIDYGPSIETPKLDSAVPNVIIKQFRYGDKPIAAGSSFEIGLDIVNTSPKVAVENIVMSIEPGESFAIDASTNVYHFASLAASGNLNQSLKLKALPSAKTGSESIEVTFRYEYVDNDKRSQANLTQKIAIPLFQPDRFEIAPPQLPETMTVGEEVVLSLAYVNKGKSEVSNVEAIIDGEIPSIAKQQNLGNFEPGKSGNISFIMTPDKAGQTKLKLLIRYEDANQEVKTKEFPITLKVNEAIPMEEPPMEEPPLEEQTGGGMKIWLMGGGLLGLSVIGYLIWRKRHHQAETIDWDESHED